MIKIRLEKWERAVVMQVLEMDDELRNKEVIFDNGDMVIASSACPSIASCGIFYVRGNKKNDDFHISIGSFDNNKERDKYYNEVVQLFKDYNNREKEEEKTEQNIFILK